MGVIGFIPKSEFHSAFSLFISTNTQQRQWGGDRTWRGL